MATKINLQRTPVNLVSEATEYNRLLDLPRPLISTGNVQFQSASSGQIYTSNTGELGILNALQPVVKAFTLFAEDWNGLNYQTPTVVGTQIRLQETALNRIFFRLSSAVTGGAITISLDGGTSSLPLRDVDGITAITDLDIGLYEVVYATTFFILRPSGGLKINALINEYVIASGENINAGDLVEFINNQATLAKDRATPNIPAVFENASVYDTSATALDSNKVLVAYRDNGNSSYGTAVVLSISGTTISVGTPVVFESAPVYFTSATTLDSTRVFVSYQDVGNSSYGTAVVLSISGTTISVGTPVVFESAGTDYTSATTLDSTKVLVAYRDQGNSNFGTAVVLTVTGATISVGTPVIFESANTTYISATVLDSTKVLVAYRDVGNLSYGTAVILTVTGTTISVGTPSVFESADIVYLSATTLDSTKVLVAYRYQGSPNFGYGKTVVLTVTGTTISVGTPVVFESAGTLYVSATVLDSTKVLVSYQDASNSSYGTAVVLSISGTVISVGTPIVFESANTSFISATTVDSTKVLVAYADGGNLEYGTASILTVELPVEGVAIQSGSAGETKKFYDWS